MQVEHLTLPSNNSLVRDSRDIAITTLVLLKPFQIAQGTALLDFPHTDFKVKITAADEGVAFDIMRKGGIATSNYCCFEGRHKRTIMQYVEMISKKYYNNLIFREPDQDFFLYSIITNPLVLDAKSLVTMGEIEFYIYYSLYLARFVAG
jgi:uncharacterized protein (UPF0262 family)